MSNTPDPNPEQRRRVVPGSVTRGHAWVPRERRTLVAVCPQALTSLNAG
jgi:hypothetical protein